jgi:threonine/homoserine/homoserine lactone efflux protein
MEFLLKGLVLGVSIAAPVGPIGVLCIRRTLAGGLLLGLVSGLGAATADAIYGSVAGFGLTYVSQVLLSQRAWLGLVGGAFLIVLGIRTIFAAPRTVSLEDHPPGLASAFLTTLLLTLTNPLTILSFGALYAGAGLAETPGNYLASGQLVMGVFLGSGLWWLALSLVVARFRTSLSLEAMRWINRGSGLVLAGFGLVVLSQRF